MAFLTTGTITEALRQAGFNVDEPRVSYLLKKARVKPLGRAGIVRIFPPETVRLIESMLRQQADTPLELVHAQPPGTCDAVDILTAPPVLA